MKLFPTFLLFVGLSTFGIAQEIDPYLRGFSGQAMVRLSEKLDNGIRVKILKVNRVWKNNRAEKPESLTGKSIAVRLRGEGEARMFQQAFVSKLENGQTFPLEIGQDGGKWFILELNGDQREIAARVLREKRTREGDSDRPKTEASRDLPREERREKPMVRDREFRPQPNRNDLQNEILREELRRSHMENAELRFRLQQLEKRVKELEKRN